MTVIARTHRPTAAGHAYVVPVVREIPRPSSAPTAGVW